jgi:hypothetical protein
MLDECTCVDSRSFVRLSRVSKVRRGEESRCEVRVAIQTLDEKSAHTHTPFHVDRVRPVSPLPACLCV